MLSLIAAAPNEPAPRPGDGFPAAPRARRRDAARPADGPEATGVAPFQDVARFVSVDPTKKRFRFYELRLQATLWGGVALVRVWGRLGTPGRFRATEYPDRAAAAAAAERAVRRRLGRGYRFVDAR